MLAGVDMNIDRTFSVSVFAISFKQVFFGGGGG